LFLNKKTVIEKNTPEKFEEKQYPNLVHFFDYWLYIYVIRHFWNTGIMHSVVKKQVRN